MAVSAVLMCIFMTSVAVTVHYKEKFYNQHCLPLRPNATLPEHCPTSDNTTNTDVSVTNDESHDKILMLLDIWPALSVILYILGFLFVNPNRVGLIL